MNAGAVRWDFLHLSDQPPSNFGRPWQALVMACYDAEGIQIQPHPEMPDEIFVVGVPMDGDPCIARRAVANHSAAFWQQQQQQQGVDPLAVEAHVLDRWLQLRDRAMDGARAALASILNQACRFRGRRAPPLPAP